LKPPGAESPMPEAGKLFVFEGPDGVGKTALATAFAEHLTGRRSACDFMSFPGREEGTLGHLVYRLHHDPGGFGVRSVRPTSVQVLHIAAHIDAIENRILPALSAGRHVVLDRFWWSTWVYGVVSKANRQALRAMIRAERACWAAARPSAAFLVTRVTSLHAAEVEGRWQELCSEYRSLAEAERHRYPIHVVPNDLTLEESLGRIIEIAGAV
jgi:dTMP kinase